jgi:hypothetical protein
VRPVEALRMQERLLRAMDMKPKWLEVAEFYTQRSGDHWLEERYVLDQATTYYVANQMNPLLEMGFRDLDDEIAIESYHIPSPIGFCVFDEPLNVGYRTLFDRGPDKTIPERHGIRAFSWITTQAWHNHYYPNEEPSRESEAVLATGYMDTLPHPNEQAAMGALTPIFTAGVFLGDGLRGLREHLMERWGERLKTEELQRPTSLSNTWPNLGPEPPSSRQGPDLEFEVEETINHCKLMMDVWFMMSQKVVEVVPQSTLLPGQLPPLIKKGKRKVRAKVPEVSVINLRRKQLVSDEDVERDQAHQAREWQHQWVVKGHWRSQPYGEGRKLRRPVYIHPHIKGPEDKPLLDNKKVYRLSQ